MIWRQMILSLSGQLNAESVDQEYTVVGIDKDLLQIPGTHYNFVKKEITEVNEDTANLKLMLTMPDW